MTSIDENTKVLYFSFLNKNTGSDIVWFQKWNEFFNIENSLRASSSTGHGAIVIELTDKNEQYLLTFGKSYSLFRDILIPNYGITIAGKLFNGKTMDSVASKYFSLTKNKSIVSYAQGATYEFEEGEAADLLKATISEHSHRTQDRFIEELLKYVKPLATISYSNIKLTISKDEIMLDDLVTVMRLLSNIEHTYDIQLDIPQMKPVKKSQEDILNQKLWEAIKLKDSSIVFSVPLFKKNSEDYYMFLDSIDSVTLKYRRSSQSFNHFCVNDLFLFVEANPKIESLAQIHCIVTSNQTEREEPYFIKWIEAQIEHNGTYYALHDGKWYSFNDNYLQRVNQRIQEIENEGTTIIIDNSFSADSVTVNQFCETNEKEIIRLFAPEGSVTLSDVYKEFRYNYYISRKKNLNLFDRCISENVELCDLSEPNESFIHCKIGDSSNLEECLRQSMLSLTYFTQKQRDIERFENKEGKQLTFPKCVKVLYLIESEAFDDFKISNLRSLKCKLTFLNWYKYCNAMRYTPKLIVARYQKK